MTTADLLLLIHEPRPAARQAGAEAWDAQQSRRDNPHATGSPEAASWDAGFDTRAKDNE